MRRRIAAAAVAVGLLAAACSSGDSDSKETRPTRKATTSTAVASDVSPLTGLPQDAATKGRPALIVKIDNAPKGRPQYGLGAADIVVEEGVEGGITRLAAIFQSKDAALVGPVRSARSSDLHIAVPLDHPLFAYSGTNSNFQALIDRAPLVNVGINKLGSAYHRDKRRSAPYNLFSSTPLLFKGTPAGAAGAKKLVDIGGAESAGAGTPVTKLDVHWVDKVRTDVTWNWDGSKWSRIQNGTPVIDASGLAITPRNIVTLFVNYVDTGERDQSNSAVPEAKLVGTGEAWIIRDGTLIKGTWAKPAEESPIALADSRGAKIALLPGQTWIEMPAPGNGSVA
ncbi:MAG: DUF3048 domain-containing protein [Actinobacteria bacterium]|nr:DUF3048 domain-containing protein [Actinomycetota bacterium]